MGYIKNLVLNNLKAKIAISTILIICLITGISTYVIISVSEKYILREIVDHVSETSKNISNSFNLEHDRDYIEYLNHLLSLLHFPHRTVHVCLSNSEGTIFLATDSLQVGKKLHLLNGKDQQKEFDFSFIGKSAFDSVIAQRVIYNKPACWECHDQRKSTLGLVEIKTTLKSYNVQMSALKDFLLGSGFITFVLMSIALSILCQVLVSRSVIRLTREMRKVEGGDLNVALTSKRKDEIGLLWNSFGKMVNTLKQHMKRVESKHQSELQQVERLATLGELASGLAHEIRNPLAGISGAVQVLSDQNNGHCDNTEILDEIQNEIERLNYSLEGFLSYARPQLPQLQEVNIIEILDQAIKLCYRSGQFNVIQLVRNFKQEYILLTVDPGQIEQVFINIVLNALQAMNHKGTLTITVEAEKNTTNNNNFIKIVFGDTGPGVSPENLKKIFQPFFSTKPNGTGLGLAISFRIVEQHNGHISISSSPGKGTLISLTLPT